jgi:hypothetical protein
MLYFSAQLNASAQSMVLLLTPETSVQAPLPDQQQLLPQVSAWLRQFPALSNLSTAQGTDWLQWRFSFAEQTFMLQYEHYTESFWIEADTDSTVMVMSELARCLQL